MTARPRVYLSGPITRGDRNWNVYQSLQAQRWLMANDFAPLNPMTTCMLPFAWEPDIPHSLWIECDLPWVEVADCVYRLPGESVGADDECEYARNCGIPVFTTTEELEFFRHGYTQSR